MLIILFTVTNFYKQWCICICCSKYTPFQGKEAVYIPPTLLLLLQLQGELILVTSGGGAFLCGWSKSSLFLLKLYCAWEPLGWVEWECTSAELLLPLLGTTLWSPWSTRSARVHACVWPFPVLQWPVTKAWSCPLTQRRELSLTCVLALSCVFSVDAANGFAVIP